MFWLKDLQVNALAKVENILEEGVRLVYAVIQVDYFVDFPRNSGTFGPGKIRPQHLDQLLAKEGLPCLFGVLAKDLAVAVD